VGKKICGLYRKYRFLSHYYGIHLNGILSPCRWRQHFLPKLWNRPIYLSWYHKAEDHYLCDTSRGNLNTPFLSSSWPCQRCRSCLFPTAADTNLLIPIAVTFPLSGGKILNYRNKRRTTTRLIL